jgi:cold shock CspA family protein
MLGTVVSWFETRNFGFIRPDLPIPGETVEIFVHLSDAGQPLLKDSRVQFEIGKFGGRTKAVNVQVIGRTIARQVGEGGQS